MPYCVRWMPLLFGSIFLAFNVHASQRADDNFTPQTSICTYCKGREITVSVDAAHHNFHTIDNRYAPFAKVLSADGLVVKPNHQKFSQRSLKSADILVIANALHKNNVANWDRPHYPAFSQAELNAVYEWVFKGGALFLIADHMPFPAASAELASLFGFGFFNGYVEVTGHSEQFFSLSDNSLMPTPVTTQRKDYPVTQVQGFLGQGFTIPPEAIPVMQFVSPAISWMPQKSWNINDKTPFFNATGLYQGALLQVGEGRVAVFGEAGMFTAQIVEDKDEVWKFGLNAASASQNEQFLLNIMSWLAEKL
ncbi:DUF4350 domain-containing protein [Alteromonas sp. ASW11-130]|uniref:DUF4350 domain-containing protein n=1 Tax=Alteromonas sp. ASW11-130 TaxID=3015775 RepID=UPI002242B853|nr:DUF4350 domain-containing protein [Alteromonas sp. ASW11-130]MCW8093308.1 DUF4350 domain-containing protein [Alteromonas sp. ASW11-130]